jgi:hypothetical protein
MIRSSSHPTLGYDTRLVCAQEVDLEGIARLLRSAAASSLYDVDPYDLGSGFYMQVSALLLCILITHPPVYGTSLLKFKKVDVMKNDLILWVRAHPRRPLCGTL